MIGLRVSDIAVLIGYFLVITAIGIASTRLVRNREDFILGGRRFGKILMALFTFGAGTHAESAVGVASQSYKIGFAGIWYQWVMLFTMPIYWLLAPVFRRARVLTTADFFERRFGSQFMLLYAGFALFVLVSMTGVMLYGSAKMVEALTGGAISWQAAIFLIAGVSFMYGIAGGLVAAVWNDFFQGILTIVMSLLIIPFFWSHIGGLHGFQAALVNPQETFRLVLSKDMTLFWIVMVSINSLFSMVVQPHIMACTAAAKNDLDSSIGFVGGNLIKRLMTVPWALTGVMAIAYFGGGKIDPDHAFGAMARELLPTGFAGLMLACVMASVMDNCAITMLSFSGIYTNSIHKRIVSGSLREAQLVKVSRIAGLVFGAITITLSFCFTDVPAAMRFLWTTIPLMGVPFFLGLLWKRANRVGAFVSFATALVAMLIGQYGLGWVGDAGLPKVITLFLCMGILSGVVASLLTRPEPKSLLNAFYLLLRTPVGSEDVLRNTGYVEIPGTGTFELPAEWPEQDQSIESVCDAVSVRRPVLIGFFVVCIITLALLGLVRFLAAWLANG